MKKLYYTGSYMHMNQTNMPLLPKKFITFDLSYFTDTYLFKKNLHPKYYNVKI